MYRRSYLLGSPEIVVTQIRGYKAGSPPRSPLRRFLPCIFIARRLQPFLSLVDSHHIAPTHASRRSQQLSPFYIVQLCSKAPPITWDSKSSTGSQQHSRVPLAGTRAITYPYVFIILQLTTYT